MTDALNDKNAPVVSVDEPIFTALNAEMVANGIDLSAIQSRTPWSEDSKVELAAVQKMLDNGELVVAKPRPAKKAAAKKAVKPNAVQG